MMRDPDDIDRWLALVQGLEAGIPRMPDEQIRNELAEEPLPVGMQLANSLAQRFAAPPATPLLSPGTYVRLKTDPTRAGVLQAGERLQASRKMVPVQFPDGRVSWLPATSLEVVPPVAAPLADRFAEGRVVGPDWLRRTFARIRVTGRLSDVVYSMGATETDFYAYQFKPVLKLLNSPTDALLIADEVGLGKTIEAGLIWTELRARLEANRLLVLCPKTLCTKWQIELDRRFGVDAHVMENAAELTQLLKRSNGRGFAAIASMQALRPPKGWDDNQEEAEDNRATPRQQLALLLDQAADGQPLIDLLVVDEAHHIRNPNTMLYGLGQLLNAVSLHRLFLSATPIHLRSRDLHSLLRLIDPDTFEYESTLDELIQMNAPIVQARDLLMKPSASVEQINARLEEARSYDLLSESKTLALIQEDLTVRPLNQSTRAELASRLEQANQLANYVTRTRRRDVQEFRVRRDAKAPTLIMHPDESAFYEAVTEEVVHYALGFAASERFLLATPQRLLSSSPAAASAYWASYGRAVDSEPVEESDQDLQDDEWDERPLVARLSELARNMNLSARLEEIDTKYALLRKHLLGLWQDEPSAKVIVFSSFKPTLAYLQRRLKGEGVGSELLHGSVKEPRMSILRRFQENPSRRVLLSSEVGSEGVDLQFCWVVVNYDLPWNPMRLEQRIGRVDRLGQTKQKVIILNLVYDGTIDDRIYHRLYERLGLSERALGEFEAILGEPIREMTLKLCDPALTEAEKTQAIEDAAQVAANLKDQEDKLESEAASLVRHGDYILEKIIESRDLNRWLSGDDILTYARDTLYRNFPGCNIEASPPGASTYRITLSAASQQAFAAFLARRGLKGATRLLNGDDQQRYRFTSSVVHGSQGRAETISQVHPLLRFAAELDRRDTSGMRAEPAAAAFSRRQLRQQDCQSGAYIVAVRHWVGRTGDGRSTSSTRLAYAGARLDRRELIARELAEALAVTAAEHGALVPNIGNDDRIDVAASVLRDVISPELDRRFEEFTEQLVAEIEDRATIQRRAVERHLESKTSKLLEHQARNRSRAEMLRLHGEDRKAGQLLSLNTAIEGKLRKLREACQLRLREIEVAREVMPEEADIATVFVEVTD